MMTGQDGPGPFVRHYRRYDRWFARHQAAYLSELLAVRALLPFQGRGLEIGVGTGRFAAPLGVEFGVEPAAPMARLARARGVRVISAVAESLPFAREAFDYVLLVTTLCFVADAGATMREAARVLRPGGALVVGLVDRDSAVGKDYLAHQAKNVFYRAARFYTIAEVEVLLGGAGFEESDRVRTLSGPLATVREIEAPSQSAGGFVVLRAALSTGATPRAG
jgi:SAM-dependent methyltransferase